MGRRKQTRGECTFCGREMTRTGLARHLPTCSARQEAIEQANQGTGERQPLYHLQIQDAWQGDFWLHLEMKGTTTLKELDHYLRAIWLECCGHLSRFSYGGWGSRDISMGKKAKGVFEPGVEMMHIYDFGTSSETMIRVVGKREGKSLTEYPIKLMARNEPLEMECMECEQSAEWMCLECVYELEESGLLCEEHMEEHLHVEYGEPVPFVNSPRVGMCGYTGPAEPPY